jgi:hypothetical protein
LPYTPRSLPQIPALDNAALHSQLSTAVFLPFFRASPPPPSLIYRCRPPPFVDTVTYEKKLPYFHAVDLYIRIYVDDLY